MKLSIVIPVHFEEKTITKVLDVIKKVVKTPYEIIIIHDLKDDPTIEVVRKYIKQTLQSNIRLEQNCFGIKRGVANAVKTGFKKAKGKAICVVMADLSDDLGKIDLMYQNIESGHDIVCGSRYMDGGKQIGGPWLKGLLSKLTGLSCNFLFKIPSHDVTNSFKVYRKAIFNEIKIESDAGFEYNLEIIAKAFKKGYKITEVPAVWRDRTQGKSKFKLFRWLPKYIKWYLFLFLK